MIRMDAYRESPRFKTLADALGRDWFLPAVDGDPRDEWCGRWLFEQGLDERYAHTYGLYEPVCGITTRHFIPRRFSWRWPRAGLTTPG
jgi:hypothetical protein